MKSNIYKYLMFVVSSVLLFSCTDEIKKSDYDYTPDPSLLPTVTLTVGDITGSTVACEGSATFKSDTTVIERGFICATDLDFTEGVVTQKVTGTDFSATVEGLTELTDYYVKSYVITHNGIAYSDVATFSTPMLKNPLLFLCGDYTETDYTYSDGSIEDSYDVKLSEIEGNTKQLTLSNFWGAGMDITVDVDTVAKTISIDPQIIYVSATYGNCYIYPITNSAVDKSGNPVVATYDDNGVITLSPWSATVTAGNFGTYSKAILTPKTNNLAGTYTEVDYLTDGSVEATYTDKIVISPVARDLSKVIITNFWDGGGYDIVASVDFDNGTISIDPQVIYVSGTYGNCYIFPYNVSTDVVDKSGTPVAGTIGTDGVITISSWAASVSAGEFGVYLNSTLTKSTADQVLSKKSKLAIFNGVKLKMPANSKKTLTLHK